MKRLISLMLMALVVAACATVPKATSSEDAAAKKFVSEAGRATIYIYRDEYAFGGARPLVVSINGESLGQTLGRTYFRFVVEPGKYEIKSFAEDVSAMVVSAAPGKSYFVRQEVKMGVMAPRSSVYLVDEETGRKGVLECELLAATPDRLSLPRQSSETVSPTGARSKSNAELLRELDQLRKDEVITEDEYKAKKKEILDRM